MRLLPDLSRSYRHADGNHHQNWRQHFTWSADGTLIVGLTACGRATVAALRLNNDYLVKARRRWVTAGWHPPQE